MAEETKFKCSGDCLNCRMNNNERKTQWQYCASQFTYNTMRMVETMQEAMKAMAGEMAELKAKINTIQDSEAMVFEPDTETPTGETAGTEDTAQGEDGA